MPSTWLVFGSLARGLIIGVMGPIEPDACDKAASELTWAGPVLTLNGWEIDDVRADCIAQRRKPRIGKRWKHA